MKSPWLMAKPRQPRQALSSSDPADGFHLPPEVSFSRQALPGGWAYVFRHTRLGELGRIVLQVIRGAGTHITCEVAGDARDPLTAERTAIFKPLGLEITRRMEAGAGGPTAADASWAEPPPRPPEPKEIIGSTALP